MKHNSDVFQLAATDLSNHLRCEHLTQLERKVALKEIKRPNYRDPSLDILIKRGQDNEAAYVKFLSEKRDPRSLICEGNLLTLLSRP